MVRVKEGRKKDTRRARRPRVKNTHRKPQGIQLHTRVKKVHGDIEVRTLGYVNGERVDTTDVMSQADYNQLMKEGMKFSR